MYINKTNVKNPGIKQKYEKKAKEKVKQKINNKRMYKI